MRNKDLNQPGIYFLWENDIIVYIGMSRTSMLERLGKHARTYQFDSFTYEPIPKNTKWHDSILLLEQAYIDAYRPYLNKTAQPRPNDSSISMIKKFESKRHNDAPHRLVNQYEIQRRRRNKIKKVYPKQKPLPTDDDIKQAFDSLETYLNR